MQGFSFSSRFKMPAVFWVFFTVVGVKRGQPLTELFIQVFMKRDNNRDKKHRGIKGVYHKKQQFHWKRL